MTTTNLCRHCSRRDMDCPIGAPWASYCIEYRPQQCQAVQYSDQKVCNRCGFTWDMNDPEPPECLTKRQLGRATIAQSRAGFRGGDK